ncbi:MAG: hypothetical protein AAB956_01520, partial [Patescibacteria group bacterium]
CEKPDNIDEKTFFSWEGSESEGYVLRNYLLKTVNASELAYITDFSLTYTAVPSAVTESVGIVFPIGSPSYGNNIKAVLQDNYNKCNQESYKLLITNPFAVGAANADCRQLYDDTGKIFYRILRDTVVIDASCQRLRKTDTSLFADKNIAVAGECTAQGGYWDDTAGDKEKCKRCYGGGKYIGDSCIYEALPSESASCQAVDNGCRAYTGNAGNNIRPGIILDTFEGDPAAATANWNVKTVATESLQTGQHSLKVNKVSTEPAERVIPVGTIDSKNSLIQNGWYELSFWARGASRNLNIYFIQEDANGAQTEYGLFTSNSRDPLSPLSTNPITIGNDWQEYRLGPTQFTGTGAKNIIIRIQTSGTASAGDYFIDNFSLSQVESSIYLVKDSWKQLVDFGGEQILADAPGSCYQGVDPRGSLPGAALGCREYKDESNNTYYLTNFSSLCREAAVGCQPMFESNNTVGEVLPTIYNLVCTGPIGECKLTIGSTVGSCFIASGETKCHVPKMVLPINTSTGEYTLLSDLTGIAGLSIDISTVYIPPENSRPIYLTNVSKYQCGADQRGCTLLGLQDQTIPTTAAASYEYSDKYILNNPDYYDSILCRQDLIGCNEYTGGANSYYFKDPVKNGNYICSYKENVDGFSGWFKNNVGACSNNGAILCKEDNDCGAGNTCAKIGSVPCYPDYLQEGNYYNIWSNKSTNYAGFVGACEQNYGGCTEFLDPQDTSSLNPEGAPYYKIFDDRLTANVADCQGQVSLKEGCVLFDKADQPNKLYNTQKTYAASDSADPRYSLVNPISSSDTGAPNNANIILKVNRDRECSEWLSCKNSIVSTNNKGEKETQCSSYQACDKLRGGQQNKRDGCANFVEPTFGNTLLDAQKYVDRDVSWYGFDYSGYSLLQRHQIGSYEYITLSNDDKKQYLGVSALLPTYSGNACVVAGEDQTGKPCGTGDQGRCYGTKCIYTIDNSLFKAVETTDSRDARIEKMRKALLPAACKAYPEDTAPFPKTIAAQEVKEVDIGNEQGQKSVIKTNSSGGAEVTNKERTEFVILNDKFSGVNVCQDGATDCSCGYKKYTYGTGGMVDYYSVSSSTSAQFAPKGICNGGDNNGKPCGTDADCGSGSSCGKLKQIDTKLGLF